MISITYDEVVALFDTHGYPLTNEIQMFGIRKDLLPDKWNDVLGVIHNRNIIAVSGTTKPGKSWMQSEEGNTNGVFILKPGMYKNCWHKGLHHQKYRALTQFSSVFEGWRDNNHDDKYDLAGKIFTDVQGLNFHTTRWDKQVQRVGDFSAGCQVCEVAKEYDQIMDIVYGSNQSLFSYALFQ